MSKCASSVISPISSSGPPSPSSAGRVTALLPPTTRVSAWRDTLAATASRIGGVACSIDRPAMLDIAVVGDLRSQFAAGFDIVAPDPPQRLAQQLRAPGRNAPG